MIHIGFLGYTFRRHSCGYLLKWLISGLQGKARFSFFNLGFPVEDSLAKWFAEQGDYYQFYDYQFYEKSNEEVVKSICGSEIEILVDIEGFSFAKSYIITAIIRNLEKRIRIISWMGFSPTGICEYTIGDYQLIPDPSIYAEKVLYLPNCYISTGGFEVADSEYSRESIGIPSDAVVYFFGQKPFKINAEIVAIINKILYDVPEAHILLKTFTNKEGEEYWFQALNCSNRVHFLPASILEEHARANLSLADIMLDSFPYNGTLTTLEGLWMGLPVVSRYGQRWAARQGKTLLHQVGLPTFPDWDGYVDYAVQLGRNSELLAQTRQQIRDSRISSPLWHYKQHATDFLAALESIL